MSFNFLSVTLGVLTIYVCLEFYLLLNNKQNLLKSNWSVNCKKIIKMTTTVKASLSMKIWFEYNECRTP